LLAYIAAVVAHPGYTRLFARDLTIPGIRVPLSTEPQAWDRAITLGRKIISLHTAATTYPDLTPHQLTSPQRPDHDGPRIIRAIAYTAEEMPDTVHYDERKQLLCIGSTGQVAPVPPPVWEYRVGGMRVVDKWIRYRLKKPRRRRASSLLDKINAPSWTRSFNDDLLDLLHVLERLIQLEPAQDVLLKNILNSPTLDTTQLRAAGVLPTPDPSRHPDDKSSPPGQLAI
jgi:predicted helicase